MSKEEINSLAIRVSEELNRYTHLLLAFSGAAIAYALNQAKGSLIAYESMLLLIALVAWCASAHYGVKHLQLHREHMIENANSLLREESMEQMLSRLDPIVKKMERACYNQYRLLVFGVALYVIWYIVDALRV